MTESRQDELRDIGHNALASLREMVDTLDNDDDDARDAARDAILEDALEVMVRSDWETSSSEFTPAEFCILLTTGGPAVRILGELDAHGEPRRAWLQVQDWGTPWTDYYEEGVADVCLTYASCFCFEGV